MPPKGANKDAAKDAPENNLPAAQDQNTGVAKNDQYPRWFVEKKNRVTGEVSMKSKYAYLEGYPREIRFDAKNGGFTIGGVTKLPETLVMLPLAWRFFKDEILGMKKRDWVEIFFLDEENNVCAVLFHDHSVKNLKEALTALHYKDQALNEVKVKVTFTQHIAEKLDGKPKYFLANFEFEEIPDEELDAIRERYEYSQTQRFYRRQTSTPMAEMELHFNYYNQFVQDGTDTVDQDTGEVVS